MDEYIDAIEPRVARSSPVRRGSGRTVHTSNFLVSMIVCKVS